ncbi:serine--tRNA ligase [Mycoplasmopsis bovis]|uniref:Serine--tRNA ligase n=3 Tax=Mycoplasmopsis bovis TaxID=28903 RepID=A0A059Y2R6_MYCBV|nr:serine--tRNA ligase [Mycoplasmopsis bovis]AEI89771.1 seryl-tRNA synthetase [Mycoplasmopsis bovis Hubei-1]AFM51438.1 seryl-tRNA synthetase [Mycoplasmopsis bovis HB0801]AIA33650.1 seryl-tRNA ligase [Mycoplasmopsis bovis CQ-W70]AKO50291.1 serine--tRNA ligase [Mycoplasmopsis bovis]AMW24774.1 seryl-tRNA synthetase [Mycoplasmopsis bovis]
MLSIKFINDNRDYVRKALENRNFDLSVFDTLLSHIDKRGAAMYEAQQKRAELSKLSKQIGAFKNEKQKMQELKDKASQLKKEVVDLEKVADDFDKNAYEILIRVPNISLDSVPVGKDENDNHVIQTHDNLGRKLVSNVLPHYEIGKKLDIFDFERAVKLSGSRFVIFKKDGAKLARALQNFMIDLHTANGYDEYAVPVLVKPEILFGTGQLPKFKDDLFYMEQTNMYLIPTAEVPLTNLYNDEIINLEKPIRLTGFTECFRSESGSGGKDMRGIIRNHQFKKVELVKITSEKDWETEYNQMLEQAKLVLEELELPYRELKLCTGDLGFSSRTTVDLEVWLPSELKYREISSVSYMGDFQARRAMIRYRDENNEVQFAHTMNGSGLAIDRLIAAILENYQNSDGTVSIPKKLIPYFGNDKISN